MGFFDKIINSFFDSYKKGLEKQMIDTTKERDPKLAQTLENLSTSLKKTMEILKTRDYVEDGKSKVSDDEAESTDEQILKNPDESATVKIGSQEWMRRNLDVSAFRNGDLIPEAITNEEWIRANENKQPAWCYYDNDPANGDEYGKLYNWYAVNDPRGLAPEGYYIPVVEEWVQLIKYLGGVERAGMKMKNTSGWERNGFGINGTNDSGFSGLAGGTRMDGQSFLNVGIAGSWWSCTEVGASSAYVTMLQNKDSSVSGRGCYKVWGQSVRCLKGSNPKQVGDDKLSTKENADSAVQADIVQIGSQKWLAGNLDVSTFRNGDPVPEAQTNGEWIRATVNKQPAWCYYKSDHRNGAQFGKLYNWYAVYDTRGLAPEGYHIPSIEEWEQLIKYLGGEECAAMKMKNRSGWERYDGGINGTDESGFSGLAGGHRIDGNVDFNIGISGNWWSCSEHSSNSAFTVMLKNKEHSVSRLDRSKTWGLSVRCIKDDNRTQNSPSEETHSK